MGWPVVMALDDGTELALLHRGCGLGGAEWERPVGMRWMMVRNCRGGARGAEFGGGRWWWRRMVVRDWR